jgi:hypothetical protein
VRPLRRLPHLFRARARSRANNQVVFMKPSVRNCFISG